LIFSNQQIRVNIAAQQLMNEDRIMMCREIVARTSRRTPYIFTQILLDVKSKGLCVNWWNRIKSTY